MFRSVVDRLHGCSHLAHTDITRLWNAHPHTVTGGQELERLAVPSATTTADVAILAGIVPIAA
jgi:hypothetical protein